MVPESLAVLTLARILRPWGRRGEVAAEILTDYPQRLAGLRQVWLSDGHNAPRPASILSCRLHRGQAIFQIEGVCSIDDAAKLRDVEIQVPLSDRVVLPPGRYYISDLVECAVWEENASAPLGKVREVQSLAENGGRAEAWLLTVETARGEVLIPLAAEICTRIDINTKRIDVSLPEGLRALNE